MVLWSTQPFTLPRSIKWVPGTPRDVVVKSGLPSCSGSKALRQVFFKKSSGFAIQNVGTITKLTLQYIAIGKTINESKYSRMDQVKFVENSL